MYIIRHLSPFIVGLYAGEGGTQKAIGVSDVMYCGKCHPREQPVPLPELK
ncbi:MAG TPA: hypothetical protein VFL17_05725 [Anaerolineae bacterium]|nr:hypothetical protein [Anaerolineae bacterium]